MWAHKLTEIQVFRVVYTDSYGEQVKSWSDVPDVFKVAPKDITEKTLVSNSDGVIFNELVKVYMDKSHVLYPNDKVILQGRTYTVMTHTTPARLRNTAVIQWLEN